MPGGGGPGLLSKVAVGEVWIGYWEEFLQKKLTGHWNRLSREMVESLCGSV